MGTTGTDLAAARETAAAFIHAFNDDDWDVVREVVAPGFVFHHPVGGTVAAGPDGMAQTWAGFKQLSPDSWHPIPVMIGERDHIAVLLPTYGTFTGEGAHAPPPTGGRLDYGMVNIVRLEGGQLAEMWFGMDSLVEMQQMGMAPPPEPAELGEVEQTSLDAYRALAHRDDRPIDNVVAFDDVVVALGPPQADPETDRRWVEVFRYDGHSLSSEYRHEFTSDPPHRGDPSADTDTSRAIVNRWIDAVVQRHDAASIAQLTSANVLVHPTAMPCEAAHYGASGARDWLEAEWTAFPDLALTDHFTVAERDFVAVRWSATGTSSGPFMGIAPTGESISYTGVTMFRVEDDEIAEIWNTRNTLGILLQLDPTIGGAGHHH